MMTLRVPQAGVKLRLQMDSGWRRNNVRQVALFLATFFGLRGLLELLLWLLSNSIGLSPEQFSQTLSDNELAVQMASLLGAGLVLLRVAAWRRELLPWPSHAYAGQWKQMGSLLLSSFTRGFAIASFAVAISVFLGLQKFELAGWDRAVFFATLPVYLIQVFTWAAWIVALELSRRLLYSIWVEKAHDSFVGRLLVIAFEAHLYFRLFSPNDSAWEWTSLCALLALLLASTQLFFFEHARAFKAEAWRAHLVRMGTQWGFWIGLFQVYGFPLANRRLLAVAHLFEGPVAERLPPQLLSPVPLLTVFVLAYLWGANNLLQRALGETLGRNGRGRATGPRFKELTQST